MKKAIFLLSVFFSFLVLRISAENILILTNPKSQETNVFRKGSYLVFELKSDNSMREGFIREIRDSSLSFENILFEGQVSLSQINILAGSIKAKIVAGRFANAVGNALIIAGTTVFDCGLDFIFYGDGNYYYWPIGGTIGLAGAFIAGIGYVFDWAASPLNHTVRVRNYRGWAASIMKAQQPISKKHIPQQKDSVQEVIPSVPAKSTKKDKTKISDDDVYGD